MRSFALALCIVAAASASPVKFDFGVFSTAEEKAAVDSFNLGKLRRYTSGASGMTSGKTPAPPQTTGGQTTGGGATPAPTPAPAGHTQITQRATIPITAQQFAQEHFRVVYERAYGVTLGIFSSETNSYVAGASVTATAVSRRSITVEYTASVPPSHADAAQTASNNLAQDPGLLANAVGAVKQAAANDPNDPLSAQIANVPTPTANEITVETPTVTIVSSGASSVAASVCTAMGLALVALRH